MELPGLAVLEERAPTSAARLTALVRSLVRTVDADRWAAAQVGPLAAAFSRGEGLNVLVERIRKEVHSDDVWAVLWSGSTEDAAVREVAGHGKPPPARLLSQTLLRATCRRGRAVWVDELDQRDEVACAASLVAQQGVVHGAVPVGERGAVYLAGRALQPIAPRARARVEALCRIAEGLVGRRPVETAPRPLPGLVGDSPAIRELARSVHGFARVPWPVLVLGETGTGKELVARALHSLGNRSEGSFVATNCATIPDTLAESTLFGHERGAFTGATERRIGLLERASGGTLFLDEVGELTLSCQAKLLRVLQEGRFQRLGGDRTLRFDGRLVAATCRRLSASDPGFRADLFHRIGVCVVTLPPLRERRGDVRSLARHLLDRALSELHQPTPMALTDEALAALEGRPWPGNVRELDNVLKASLAGALMRGRWTLDADDLVDPASAAVDLPIDLGPTASSTFQLVGPRGTLALSPDLKEALDQVRQAVVDDALTHTDGNRPKAAARLGVSRQWLHTLLQKFDAALR